MTDTSTAGPAVLDAVRVFLEALVDMTHPISGAHVGPSPNAGQRMRDVQLAMRAALNEVITERQRVLAESEMSVAQSPKTPVADIHDAHARLKFAFDAVQSVRESIVTDRVLGDSEVLSSLSRIHRDLRRVADGIGRLYFGGGR